jgi:hypothetical protein
MQPQDAASALVPASFLRVSPLKSEQLQGVVPAAQLVGHDCGFASTAGVPSFTRRCLGQAQALSEGARVDSERLG